MKTTRRLTRNFLAARQVQGRILKTSAGRHTILCVYQLKSEEFYLEPEVCNLQEYKRSTERERDYHEFLQMSLNKASKTAKDLITLMGCSDEGEGGGQT